MAFLALVVSLLAATPGALASVRVGRRPLRIAMSHASVLVGAAVVGAPVAYWWLAESIGRGRWAGALAWATGVAVWLGAAAGVRVGEWRQTTLLQAIGAASAGAVGVCIGLFALVLGQHTWAELPVIALVPVDGASLAVAASVWLRPGRR